MTWSLATPTCVAPRRGSCRRGAEHARSSPPVAPGCSWWCAPRRSAAGTARRCRRRRWTFIHPHHGGLVELGALVGECASARRSAGSRQGPTAPSHTLPASSPRGMRAEHRAEEGDAVDVDRRRPDVEADRIHAGVVADPQRLVQFRVVEGDVEQLGVADLLERRLHDAPAGRRCPRCGSWCRPPCSADSASWPRLLLDGDARRAPGPTPSSSSPGTARAGRRGPR